MRPDGATWTAGHAWDEVRVLSPPSGLKLEGDRAKYLGKFLFVNGKFVNGRPAWQHTVVASPWIVHAQQDDDSGVLSRAQAHHRASRGDRPIIANRSSKPL